MIYISLSVSNVRFLKSVLEGYRDSIKELKESNVLRNEMRQIEEILKKLEEEKKPRF